MQNKIDPQQKCRSSEISVETPTTPSSTYFQVSRQNQTTKQTRNDKLGTRRRTRTAEAQSSKPYRGYRLRIHSSKLCFGVLPVEFYRVSVLLFVLLAAAAVCDCLFSIVSHPCSAYKLCPIFLLALAPQRHRGPLLALAIEHLAAARITFLTSTPSGTKAVCWFRSRAPCPGSV